MKIKNIYPCFYKNKNENIYYHLQLHNDWTDFHEIWCLAISGTRTRHRQLFISTPYWIFTDINTGHFPNFGHLFVCSMLFDGWQPIQYCSLFIYLVDHCEWRRLGWRKSLVRTGNLRKRFEEENEVIDVGEV